MSRTILHCDCNGFYASVECVLRPELRNVPMAVGGNEENRHGIILAKNELAKKYDVRTAETIWQARKKCPDLVIVPPQHNIYRQYSKRVMDIYKRYTDFVESFGLDEAWLDVTGSKRLFGDGVTIANELRRVVKEETGLTISVGVSFCKVFAKLGSDYKKPDATTVFSEENWKTHIFPMSVDALLYVGKNTKKVLDNMNIHTIGDLAKSDRALLEYHLGKAGGQLYEYANGLDNSPVASIYKEEEIKSIGNGETFGENLIGEDAVFRGIIPLCDKIARRMRDKGLKCTTIQVHIKNPEFKTISRQVKTDYPTYSSREIRRYASELIKKSWNFANPVRMISVTGTGLIKADEVREQISLFDEDYTARKKTESVEKTLDKLKNKFGDKINLGI